jgi:hypothetical protein
MRITAKNIKSPRGSKVGKKQNKQTKKPKKSKKQTIEEASFIRSNVTIPGGCLKK